MCGCIRPVHKIMEPPPGMSLKDWLHTLLELLRMLPKGSGHDIRPTDRYPVACIEPGAVEITAQVMRWGHKPEWSKSVLFNARDDKLRGRYWSGAFERRRALVLVDGFVEWTGEKKQKIRHEVDLAGGRMMALAGLWQEDPDKGRWFSIVTTEPCTAMQPYHHREPVMLHPEHWELYLTANTAPFHLLKPYDGDLEFHPPI